MGIYIGYIDKVAYERDRLIFFNFKPIAEVTAGQIHQLSAQEQAKLLPESEKRDINFAFSWANEEARKQMNEMFTDHALMVFEFTLADLEPNMRHNSRERNQTGYKVQAIPMIEEGKIRPLDSISAYALVRKEQLLSDFYNDAVVEIDANCALCGKQAFVELEDVWAGPYEIGVQPSTATYYIRPQIKENKYSVMGYRKADVEEKALTATALYWGEYTHTWSLLVPKAEAKKQQIDVISDTQLLESFRDSLHHSQTVGQRIALNDIPALLKRYEESLLAGSVLTVEVRRNRLKRLLDLLTAEGDVDGTLETAADFICELLVKYQDSPNVEEWLKSLLAKHPELIEGMKESQVITQHMAQLEQSLADLQQERSTLEQTIEQKRAEADAIENAAIEAKKRELLRMDAEYEQLRERIKAGKEVLAGIDSLSDLRHRQSVTQQEVDYLEKHRSHLERETRGLQLQFQQLLNSSHDKMVSIAFDGFMANKLLQAAAQWEAQENQEQAALAAARNANVRTAEKTPAQLVDYLCAMVQTVRPAYSRNTIVNIAVCLTQGFLTVFSGEPGCGKTSICNIFAEVLGLYKVSEQGVDERYVSVSVERGWTSKRDFIGYYNPLTKSFDKSNRRVYDALQQLSYEETKGIHRMPYVILLDEANLSPMEYYWSDFMNLCDEPRTHGSVNLGEDFVFAIPDTLHFLATINNDHTTETLSPRLIDRAMIITLPKQGTAAVPAQELPKEQLEVISWSSLCEAFLPSREACVFPAPLQRMYDTLSAKLREQRFSISPRVDMAIKRYWAAASRHFEMDETKTKADIVALDYALAQRVLPKLSGSGERFEQWLEELKSLCSGYGLNMSAKLVKDMIARGNEQMKYYQFFC